MGYDTFKRLKMSISNCRNRNKICRCYALHNAGPDLLLRLKKAIDGGLTMSLKRPVPQTNSTKPTTCSHLKVSQPSPRLTIQMKRVRHVSIVLREVAEMTRVTLRPKKLKPLPPD
jgi:hypothetical protein